MKCRHWTLSFARLVAEMQVAARTGALWLAVRARWLAWGGQGSYRCSPDGLNNRRADSGGLSSREKIV
jgi:hypothetical protein